MASATNRPLHCGNIRSRLSCQPLLLFFLGCALRMHSAASAFVAPPLRIPFTGREKGPLAAAHHRLFGSSPSRRMAPLETTSADDDALPFIPDEWRGEVLKVLSAVIDPDLNRDIVTLGFVQNLSLDESDRTVSFDVELTTPACPIKEQFASECERLVSNLPWTNDVKVTMTAQEATPGLDTDVFGMAQVGAVIAVSSCKGGVGKSTTAVNLAYALRNLGASVGIFDADLYGPSLPTMIEPDDDSVRFVGRQIAPLSRDGVKLMSFGYVNEGSAVMRGPMVTQLLDQFLSLTNWGKLDYLVLDMPPGTGDIQLTLSQRLNITAAVIVTTPQELSFADVVRGIDMFDSVNVPCVAVVENMAYYEVDRGGESSGGGGVAKLDLQRLRGAFVERLTEGSDGGDEATINGNRRSVEELADDLVGIVRSQEAGLLDEMKEGGDVNGEDKMKKEQVRIFGRGHKQRLSEQWGIEHTFSVPLLGRIAAAGDSGTPFVVDNPDTPQADVYRSLAASVVSEVAKAKFDRANNRPVVSYDDARHIIQVMDEGGQDGSDGVGSSSVATVGPAELRRACRCAACVEELTGRQLLIASDIPETIRPTKMEPCGNYALSVDWSDGHRSLYPYRQIRSLLDAKEEAKEEVAAL